MSGHRYNLRNRGGGSGAEKSVPSTPAAPKPRRSATTTTTTVGKKKSAAVATNIPSTPKTPQEHPPAVTSTTAAVVTTDYKSGTNWVHDGGIEANPYLFVLLLISPFVSLLLAYITSAEMTHTSSSLFSWRVSHPITEMIPACFSNVPTCLSSTFQAGTSILLPTPEGAKLVLFFMLVALILERTLPGKYEFGPETSTGHVPKYVDNGVKHCVVFSVLFFLGSNIGPCGKMVAEEQLIPLPDGVTTSATVLELCKLYEPYNFGVLYDVFPSALSFLNLFGFVFCIFLMYKGLYYPSTQDYGSSGSVVKDFLWGTELYPRVFGLDLKRFINCRFSMTFWQLAGFSFCYRSYVLRGNVMDWGLFFSALSQYLYLVKFFIWEMGYMRSIDIIVDRAGYEIQWGCLVWVPALYTFHSRFLVQNPSGLSFSMALAIFIVSMAGVLLNYAADRERDVFRASNGKCLVWGKKPRYITAKYTVVDRKTGKETEKTSLLLASGFWGMARHFQYFFELTAAYSWCFLANPAKNGILVMLYAVFLTALLVDRAKRDTDKCRLKYGKYYEEYCDLVPYKIVPGIF